MSKIKRAKHISCLRFCEDEALVQASANFGDDDRVLPGF